jgi:hypothetical protein
VWAFTGVGGGYAEQAAAPAATLIPLPATMSAVGAVTLGSSAAVAHFGLRRAHFVAGPALPSFFARLDPDGRMVVVVVVGAVAGGPPAGVGMQMFGAFRSRPCWRTRSWMPASRPPGCIQAASCFSMVWASRRYHMCSKRPSRKW